MDIDNEHKLKEYNSQIQYLHSTLNFNIKIENEISIKLILTYEKEIEYSAKYDFIYIQEKYPQFKKTYDFFEFLNKRGKDIFFHISELNKEYCDLDIGISKNELKFTLLNQDKNKNIDLYKENKLLNTEIGKLIELCGKDECLILNDINFEKAYNSYRFRFSDHSYIIFISKIKVIIHTEDKKIIEGYIQTNYDIYNLLKENNLDEKDVFCENYQLGKVLKVIDLFIKDKDKLSLKIIKKQIPETKFGQKVLDKNKDYQRQTYSEYFEEYFENFNSKNKGKIFKFENNEFRNDIFRNLLKLKYIDEIQKYKITGPFSTGKSVTLFLFSRFYDNVIYINLKVIKRYKDDYKKCLKIIFSECCRVILDNSYFRYKIALLKFEDNVLNQLLTIIKVILELVSSNIILILDQYKPENIEYEPTFKKKIKEFLRNEKFRIVYCSSINDNKCRDKVLKTWSVYKGNPEELNETTQKYYFYYYKLYSHKKSTNLAYKLFHNKYKYIKKAEKDKDLSSVYNKIIEKLQKFQIHQIDKLKNLNNFNLSDILLFMKYYINIKLNKSSLLEVISMIPLKYFNIDIQPNYYLIEPAFPYIIYCISKYININDCDEFFSQKKYLNISFLSNKVKGEYFEYSTIKALQNPNIIKMPFDYKNIEEVRVNEIVRMNELESSLDNVVGEYNEKIKNQENNLEEYDDDEEENKLEKNEEKEEIEEITEIVDNKDIYIDKNKKLNINMDKKYEDSILVNKIEQTISKYYLKEFSNIFYDKINQKEDYLRKFDYLIAKEEKEFLKRIKDYKREIYEKEIIERGKTIMEKIKKEKDIREKNNKKGQKGKTININTLKIPITEKNKTKNKKYDSRLKSYSGNENFYIIQENPNGKLLDYAILYGEKNEKIFLGFQMKCYSSETNIDNEFIDKGYIKKTLSPILLNSIHLFNCLIKEWHYFLIYYYNKNDEDNKNNVGYKAQLSTFQNKIEYLLFDPNQKIFYSKDTKTKITKLELSNFSNLDNISYLNNCYNYLSLPQYFSDKMNNEEYEENYLKGLNQFVNDFQQYSSNPQNILKVLSEKLGIQNIFYCLSFHFLRIEIPVLNIIILYKKKESTHFMALFLDTQYNIIDLEDGKKLNFGKCQELIDFNYNYSYLLRFNGRSKKRVGSDECIDNLIRPQNPEKTAINDTNKN